MIWTIAGFRGERERELLAQKLPSRINRIKTPFSPVDFFLQLR